MLIIKLITFFSSVIPLIFTINFVNFHEYCHSEIKSIINYRIKDFIMIIILLRQFQQNLKQLHYDQFIMNANYYYY